MKKIQHLIEYYSLKIFAAAILLMPLGFGRFVARRLGDLAYYVIPIRKRHMTESLTIAFGNEKTPAQIQEIVHGVYRQFGLTMMELLHFPKLTRERIADMVTLENLDVLDRALAKGKGAVMVGAHFGNWELMGAALAHHYPMSFVVGQQENSKVDDLLNSYRTNQGIKLIPLKLSLRGVMKALKNNECIAILSDQDAHEQGAFVEFFGRPASTPRGAAMFALRSGAPIITGTIFRESDRFRVVLEEIPAPGSGDDETDIVRYTAAFVKVLEKHCRTHPDHWFWLHRRWKTKPPAGAGTPAARIDLPGEKML